MVSLHIRDHHCPLLGSSPLDVIREAAKGAVRGGALLRCLDAEEASALLEAIPPIEMLEIAVGTPLAADARQVLEGRDEVQLLRGAPPDVGGLIWFARDQGGVLVSGVDHVSTSSDLPSFVASMPLSAGELARVEITWQRWALQPDSEAGEDDGGDAESILVRKSPGGLRAGQFTHREEHLEFFGKAEEAIEVLQIGVATDAKLLTLKKKGSGNFGLLELNGLPKKTEIGENPIVVLRRMPRRFEYRVYLYGSADYDAFKEALDGKGDRMYTPNTFAEDFGDRSPF